MLNSYSKSIYYGFYLNNLLLSFYPYKETKNGRRKFYKENKKTITREIVLIRDGEAESREESRSP